ncbi:DegT/DnrJ/EryC1/StrS family aminotransferase [Saccharothrix violaceirubra]|uniref:dTDP-4-amino-4,6-dideoxygalactose transaminase n=1 Tax=Saccharothrix violaceirubra TaxID=413306 RepID=A0A7W7WWH1_9PSEU|nr:DegT/DnrJ/EryC1/StrS family aminotransferase [Saccharothrix violaceirubra]MBB4966106.1 dTDP-4-amino-4,6-dideoxygalactose transaminase [Saccharothrix violaceirubra]
MKIPFRQPDLVEEDRELLLAVVERIGRSAGPFVLGEHTARFEAAVCSSAGVRAAVACASGTSALALVLSASGVGPDDEVVVPAYGSAPPAAASLLLGAVPVFADVDPVTAVLDPDDVGRLLTARTRAVLPSHQFAVRTDTSALRRVAVGHGVPLIEEAAVNRPGTFGGPWTATGVLSFGRAKGFGLPGEGAIVVTDDLDLAQAVRVLRDHGRDGDPEVSVRIGASSRFDEVQAAFLLHRMDTWPRRLDRAVRIGGYYSERFAGLAGVVTPSPGSGPVYALHVDRRDPLRDHLAARGIGTHVPHPVPLPRQPVFAAHAQGDRDWPAAELVSRTRLALPLHPGLTDAEVEVVADEVCRFAQAGGRS